MDAFELVIVYFWRRRQFGAFAFLALFLSRTVACLVPTIAVFKRGNLNGTAGRTFGISSLCVLPICWYVVFWCSIFWSTPTHKTIMELQKSDKLTMETAMTIPQSVSSLPKLPLYYKMGNIQGVLSQRLFCTPARTWLIVTSHLKKISTRRTSTIPKRNIFTIDIVTKQYLGHSPLL